MNRSALVVLLGGALAAGHLHAATRVPAGRPAAVRDTPAPKPPGPVDAPGVSAPAVRIARIRLETPPEDAPQPSMLLKFDMLNEGLSSVTDVVIEIAILKKPAAGDAAVASRPVVGPFTISGHATIDGGDEGFMQTG